MSSQSPPETPTDEPTMHLSLTRKFILLLLFCFAEFLDTFNNSALVPAIPPLEASMGITESQSAWLISAFKLTFASFLLISGRISDVYDPKKAFITGVFFMGIISFGAGFVSNRIAIIALRSLMGIASAMTIPSSLALIMHVFPEPLEQARAIGVFGGCGTVGNVLGLFIGAVLVQYASYHWVFWFVAIIAIPVALACIFIIPSEVAASKDRPDSRSARWQSLDLIGVFILTAALILFMYAVTSGSVDGWATAGVLAPLIISVLLIIGFFYWETLVPADKAAIAVFIVFTTLWQDVFHWTVISTALHMSPIGVAAFMMSFTGSLSRLSSPKWMILAGYSMVALATILLAVGGSQPEGYWPYIFPAFVVGSAGAMLTYTHTNIAMFRAAPAYMAGTVGALCVGALELGSGVGLAVFLSIETSVEATHGGPQEYYGRAVAFWFLLGIVVIEILSLSYFYQTATDHGSQPKLDDDDAERASYVTSNNARTVKV
ncbi:major facilitator superfamily domain-containing protein [Boletus edulis]|uniref:Major facilitator superfamily domain-containing protein n=1 Tax=Boletus edulis BED1 TaxID=1328754 RepID=A0AAD4G888_BOLED|nr:major facilitator superfamily domain-containing protein [Boletus edulis]KAF8429969.1 major facilitator superfamily domain-containing protein [Boletus edulis BED1]